MARPRKPAHLRLVEGDTRNKGASAHAKALASEPIPPNPLGDPPADLDPVEQEVWERLGKELPAGMLRSVDMFMVRSFCMAVSMQRDAWKKLKASSFLVKTPSGMAVQSPYMSIVNRQTEVIVKVGAQLGLSPVARTRIAMEEGAGDADPTDRFFG